MNVGGGSMKKKLVLAVLLLAATYTNSLGDSVRIVSPSGTGAPHSCDVRRYYPKDRFPRTSILVFPLTWISKRIERGETVVVSELFTGMIDLVREMARDPEYQRH